MTPRAGEELPQPALSDYLRGRLEGAEHGVEVRQFPGGHSNLTYLLQAGEREYVLRRPPHGPVAPRAHDMAREYTVLRALHPVFPLAPEPYLLCEDTSVIGAVFFVMERRQGVVLRREMPDGFPARLASEAFIDTLAALHRVDIDGLALGRPAGFLERQVRGWSDRWERAQTDRLPAMDDVMRWLAADIPESGPPAIVHNDYKLDNVMLDSAEPVRVSAILDWEMTTVGDPLVDLGCTLCYWPEAGDPEARRESISPITTLPGWHTRAELTERYAAHTGRDLSRLGYYEVFGIFKLAVILQQIYYRYRLGQTRDERFRDFDRRVRGLVEAAAALAEHTG
jgi:aminoglycoside phosphotransferase (APT) family kinase protein